MTLYPARASKWRGNKISQMALQTRPISIVLAVLLHLNPPILVVLIERVYFFAGSFIFRLFTFHVFSC